MKKKLITALVATNMVLIALFLLSANGVLISNNAGNAHSSAALEVRSTSQGFLPPVMTSTQRDNISSPATGLTIYNNTTNTTETYNGSTWQSGGSSSGSVPAGTVMAYAGSTVPTGWLECNGDDISRTTYANLFSAIGTAWGYGDQSTTFNLPDMRGVFLRGHNNNKTSASDDYDPNASSRTALNPGGNTGDNVGTYQSDLFASHNHGGGNHSHNTSNFSKRGYPDGSGDRTTSYYFMHSSRGTDYKLGTTSSGTIISTQGGDETRPVNVAVKYIIKY